jgi:branched-chain amino acid transport system ATP-binding protein
MVAIGRGLMSRPDLLAIDEMSLGLAPIVVQTLSRILGTLNRERGLALLLVEQSARVALELCTRGYVLESGKIVASGTTNELRDGGFIEHAYLGGQGEAST